MLDNLHQAAEMGQDSTAHENSDLLYDLDTRVTSLPGFLALANSLEERQERWNAQGRRYNGESTSCRVSHILVHVVNIRPHGGDHSGQTSSLLMNKSRLIKLLGCCYRPKMTFTIYSQPSYLCQVGDDLSTLYSSIVIFINQQGLNHHKNL